MSHAAIAHSATKTAPEANEPDYAALFANAAHKTDTAAPPKGRKRMARHVVDRRPLTRSRV
eukprot:6203594-Prymnesium_polylepis.1